MSKILSNKTQCPIWHMDVTHRLNFRENCQNLALIKMGFLPYLGVIQGPNGDFVTLMIIKNQYMCKMVAFYGNFIEIWPGIVGLPKIAKSQGPNIWDISPCLFYVIFAQEFESALIFC